MPAASLSRIQGVGFPHAMISKIRYCDDYQLTSTLGSLGKQIMRWNSTFDPDFTGAGHQPLYRDTFAAIYDQYSVITAYTEVKIINTSTTAPIVCGVLTEDDTSTSADVRVLMEQATGLHTILPPLSGSLSTHTFRLKWDCKKTLHIDPFSSETYKTAVGSNPTEESDLLIWMATLDATTASLYCNVTMVYEVLWTELSTPVLS
jgi:hypothetical protein